MAELRTNNEEQAERLLRVLHLREEVRCKTEGERDLRRLVEVRLEDVPAARVNMLAPTAKRIDSLVEDQEALQHLQLVLVRCRAPDLVVQLVVRQRLLRLQTLVRQCRPVITSQCHEKQSNITTYINWEAWSAAG